MLRAVRHLDRGDLAPIAVANDADSTAIASTTAETTFDVAGEIPAQSIHPGAVFRIFASGGFSTAIGSAKTLRIRVNVAGDEVYDSNAISVAASITSSQFRATLVATCRSGGLHVSVAEAAIHSTSVHAAATSTTSAIEPGSPQAVEVTAEWNESDASNSVTLETLTVERLA